MRLRELSSFVLAACLLLTVACGGDDNPAEPQPDPPVVAGVSATTVAPGDTLVISGSNFTSPASSNQVRFTNPLGVSTPFAGNSSELDVVVDQDATTGPLTVSNAGGSDNGPDVTVTRGIGAFFVFGGLGASNELALPNPTATTRYLVIPHGTNANAPFSTDYGYQISSANTLLRAAAADRGPTRRAAATLLGIAESFDASRWEQARELVERVGVPKQERRPIEASAEVAAPFRQFYVLNTASGSATNPANYDHITADLRYTGTKCLVYADVDTSANPANNFDTIHFQQFGQAFDTQIEATNVSYFGPYEDVDGNGKVIILITPVVNRMTPPGSGGFIAGFFLSIDLYTTSQVPAGTTNHAEIFYVLASDPTAEFNPGIPPFPIAFTADENIGTIAHEHEHMISFSHRIFHEGGVTQETWLEEGMAHMAEDLNGRHDANIGRADIYMQDPGGISLEHATAPLNQRGGIYLFLRLMADRYGTDILKDIVQSKCTGRACIKNVTGRDFYDLLPEFLAALYVSGKGITADPRFNFTSIDLADYGTVTASTAVIGLDAVGDVRRSSGDLYLFDGVLGQDTRLTFFELAPTGVRLRDAIVRVQ
jgi:hypothetical protein